MADPLHGISENQQHELIAILQRLGRLWVDLTEAATGHDQGRAEAIQREITQCRQQVEEIKRAGTIGLA